MKRRRFLTVTSGPAAVLCALTAESSAKDSVPGVNAAGIERTASIATATEANSSMGSIRTSGNVLDPTYIDPRLDSRSVSFENLTGDRGNGAKIGNGRKDRPFRIVDPGEKVVLADIKGPGTLRHIWTMLSGLAPEVARALCLEVFYDGLSEPSICVPILDFFGLPHGRVAEYYSAMVSANEGRGLNSFIPIPFARSIRVEFTNDSVRHIALFYQIDYTLEPSIRENRSYLHATFRRENPTTLRRDFVIAEGLKGPGRFLGCALGVRVLEKGMWYGEGEVKIYRDGDRDFPTICGTGLEDYVGSAWGLGRHYGPYAGAPINIPAPAPEAAPGSQLGPDLVSFYRWHIPDPIMFSDDLRVTIQQIGAAGFAKGQEAQFEAYKQNHPTTGHGWMEFSNGSMFGLYERSDDYCATAFVYCTRPQPVPRFNTDVAVRDVGWLPVEQKSNPVTSMDEREQVFINMREYWSR